MYPLAVAPGIQNQEVILDKWGGGDGGGPAAAVKGKRKAGVRLWIRFDRLGDSELIECDNSAIIRRAAIPARDLRILGRVFSQTSNILGEEICDL